MILEAVRDRLVAATSLGLTRGSNLFIHAMPPECRDGAMLRFNFGGIPIDAEKDGFRKTSFQLIVRAENLAAGEQRARDIMAELTTETETAWTGLQIKYLRPRDEPFVFPASATKLWEVLVVFLVCYVLD